MKVLASLHADVNQANNNGATPLKIATQQGKEDTAAVLRSLGGRMSTEAESKAKAAAKYGKLSQAQKDTQLYSAARAGKTEEVELLILAGANPTYVSHCSFSSAAAASFFSAAADSFSTAAASLSGTMRRRWRRRRRRKRNFLYSLPLPPPLSSPPPPTLSPPPPPTLYPEERGGGGGGGIQGVVG